MIDFRYHIVSLIAVFLALGLGILMGSTVLDRVTVAALEGRVDDLSSRLGSAREDISELRRERDRTNDVLEAMVPWAVSGRLQDRAVLSVVDGGEARWRDEVQQRLLAAGARPVGTITFTDRWRLQAEGSQEQLQGIVAGVTPAFDPGTDPVPAAMELLGQRLLEPTGRELVRQLTDAGFLLVDGVGESEEWPPAGSAIVGYAAVQGDDAPARWLARFLRGTSRVAPTLAVSGTPHDADAVALLRGTDGLPPTISTFDAAGDDPTRAGAVLALRAAVQERGGHFGIAGGLRLVPPPAPASATPEPTPTG